MSGIFGGHSPLGKKLNQIGSKTDHLDIDRFKTARAILIESYKGLYVFKMGLLNSKGEIVKQTGPIPIIGPEDQLAMFYGSPEKLVQGDKSAWEAIIFYKGTSVSNGVALITRQLQELEGGRFEATTLANELLAKGTSFAPPGAGM